MERISTTASERDSKAPEGDAGVVTKTRTRPRTKRPPRYRVLMHNDNYTTRDFVVHILEKIFRKNPAEAVDIMMRVHHEGVGVAGIYTREIAETKVYQTEQLSRQQEFPLALSIEPEDDGGAE